MARCSYGNGYVMALAASSRPMLVRTVTITFILGQQTSHGTWPARLWSGTLITEAPVSSWRSSSETEAPRILRDYTSSLSLIAHSGWATAEWQLRLFRILLSKSALQRQLTSTGTD